MRSMMANNHSAGVFFLLELGENTGVAAAQNKGLVWARESSYEHVLLLDQDSIPAADMVQTLQNALINLEAKDMKVAAVGPRLVDRRTNHNTHFIEINWFGITRKHYADHGKKIVKTDFLVSSGMLASVGVFNHIGLLEEAFFIDNVDLEWCFRARAMGYHLYGVFDAIMQHNVGDQVFRIGPGTFYRHNPERQYYIMRNRLVLYRRNYSPNAWIVQDIMRAIVKFVMFSLFFAPRLENIRMMCCGIRDAFAAKLGKFDA